MLYGQQEVQAFANAALVATTLTTLGVGTSIQGSVGDPVLNWGLPKVGVPFWVFPE